VGRAFSPLDEELALLPGRLSPRLHEGLVRLGTWIPSFAQAARALAWFGGVDLSAATACRLTEAAGAALVALETADAERLERERPAAPAGPRVQQVSADGAMVPLVKGEWAEVKTVAVGTVAAVRGADGEPVVRTGGVSYFSRLADSETFGRLALVELHRRGTPTAGTVVAVLDGSVWLQVFIDLHRPDAIRILDFPHAVEHLSAAVQAALGIGAAETAAWLAMHAHELKTGDPAAVLAALGALPVHDAADPAAAALARDQALAYLAARREQIAYARFRALGFPIGSGMVESANKLVVEERLKGPGMHWARGNVDPMLALRCAAGNDRWDQVWPRVVRSLRRAPEPCPTRARRPTGLSAHQASRPIPHPRPPRLRVARPPSDRPKKIVAGRPTRAHRWNLEARRAAERQAARRERLTKS
jgi:hypothetical protein